MAPHCEFPLGDVGHDIPREGRAFCVGGDPLKLDSDGVIDPAVGWEQKDDKRGEDKAEPRAGEPEFARAAARRGLVLGIAHREAFILLPTVHI